MRMPSQKQSSMVLALLFVLILSPAPAGEGMDDFKNILAAAENNQADAQFLLGDCYYKGRGIPQNYQEAAKWFRKAADQMNADAQYYLGVCYANGQGVEKNPQAAAEWIRRASDHGNPEAMNTLGLLHSSGSGVRQDYSEAVSLFRRAADSGNNDALKNLALCYANGLGVAKDMKEAVKLLKTAASAGSADAQYNLGVSYVNGSGVEANYEQGIMWLKKAIQNGFVDTQGSLDVALAKYAHEKAMQAWAKAKGIEFNKQDDRGRTLAHNAVEENRLDILAWLKENGDDLNRQDDDGITPVDMATIGQKTEIVNWFKENGIVARDAKVDMKWAEDMRSAGLDDQDIANHALAMLCKSAGTGDVKMMKNCLHLGVNVNGAESDGSTPLHFAVHAKNRQSIKFLKSRNANPRAKDARGFTPVDYAKIRLQDDVLEWLGE